MMRRIVASLFLAVVYLALGSPNVFAQQLDYCTGDNACTCAEFAEKEAEYDDCNEFGVADLISVEEPSAVREAYNATSTFDSETATHHVHAEITTAPTKVLPLHPNRGRWESIEEFQHYFTEAFGLEPALDLDEHNLFVEMDGAYGRFNVQEGVWTDYQSGSLFNDLASGPEGNVSINGESLLSPSDLQCSKDKTDGQLEASQCMDFNDWESYQGPALTDGIITRDFDVEWLSTVTVGRYYNQSFVWADVKADRIEIDATYCVGSSDPRVYGTDHCEDTNVAKEVCRGDGNGGRATGNVYRGTYNVEMGTAIGSWSC